MFHFDTSVLAKEALLMRARRFFSGTKKTILLPMAGSLYGADMQEGKFLHFASVPFPTTRSRKRLPKLWKRSQRKASAGNP